MREIVSGIGLMIVGLAYALSTCASLPLGTLRQMGAGMFPFGVGALLLLVGGGIALQGYFQRHELPHLALRPTAAVLGAAGAFALTIGSFGLFPAIAMSTVLSSLAVPGVRVRNTVLLCLGLMFIAWVIFITILSVPVETITWRV